MSVMETVSVPGVLVVPKGKHSLRGASSAKRWTVCTASPQLIAKLPPSALASSIEADEGTAAHLLFATCLLGGDEPWMYAGYVIKVGEHEFTVDDEMVTHITNALAYVHQRMEQFKDKGARIYIERGLSSILDDEAYGTADVVIEVPGDRIIIIDLKYGFVTVEPKDPQLRYYGYLVVENTEDPSLQADSIIVELVIIQPRMPHPKGPNRKLVTNVRELTDWFQNDLIPTMQVTRSPEAQLVVNPLCRFCPARMHCEMMKREIESFPTGGPEPVEYSNEELGELWLKGKIIVATYEAIKKEAYKRRMQGQEIPNTKLVRKLAPRVFKEKLKFEVDGQDVEVTVQEAAKQKFGQSAWTKPEFKSPAQIEKLADGKAFVTLWSYAPDTGLTIADIDDKREPVRRSIEVYQDMVEGSTSEPSI